MIARLSGTLLDKTPPYLVIDVNGVGYEVEAPSGVFSDLPENGKQVAILTKMALTILSGASGEELARYVATADVASLVRMPGIGKKTAERIIMELRDKLEGLNIGAGTGSVAGGSSVSTDPATEASHALASLGYKPAEVSRMISTVAEVGMDAEEIIRKALGTRVKPNG